MENKTVVLYHANCNDGFTAAWISSKVLPKDTEFIAVNYGENPPEITNANIYILDFSYKTDVISKMARNNINVVVLDHHATAEKELMRSDWPDEDVKHKVKLRFDMSKSGARLTFEYFGEKLSNTLDSMQFNTMYELVKYTEDRDLWKWKLEWSKQINAYISLFERTFDNWDRLSKDFSWRKEEMVDYGGHVLSYQHIAAKESAKKARIINLEGYEVPILNATGLISEIGHELCKSYPFSISYFINEKAMFIFSLRGNGSIDVSAIAKKIAGDQGGGHFSSSGMQLTLSQVLKYLPILDSK